jgi:hypothetical protein
MVLNLVFDLLYIGDLVYDYMKYFFIPLCNNTAFHYLDYYHLFSQPFSGICKTMLQLQTQAIPMAFNENS